MPHPVVIRLLTLVGALLWATGARAGCSPAPASLAFAASSSYDVRLSGVPQAAGQAGLSCTGSFLGVAGGSSAKATVTSANNFRLIAGSDAIPYQVSADAAGNYPFSQGGTIDYFSGALLTALGNGATSFNAAIYGKLTAAPNVAAGTYQDTLTVTWNYSVCDGVQVTNAVCTPSYTTGRTTVTIVVTLVVAKDCRITAPNVTFASAPLVTQVASVSNVVLVSCTKSAAYSIAFSSGLSGSARPWRAMSDGAGHSLQYNIYRPDGVTIWDESNPQPSAVPGTGDTTPGSAQAYVAKVNPVQTPPRAGSYTDAVSVIVSF